MRFYQFAVIRNSLEERDIVVRTAIDRNNLIAAGKSLNPCSNSMSQTFPWRHDDSTTLTKNIVMTGEKLIFKYSYTEVTVTRKLLFIMLLPVVL